MWPRPRLSNRRVYAHLDGASVGTCCKLVILRMIRIGDKGTYKAPRSSKAASGQMYALEIAPYPVK